MTFIIIEIKGFNVFLYGQLCCLYMIGHLVLPQTVLGEESLLNQPSYLPSIDPEQILNSSVKERTTYTRKTMVNLRDSANSVKVLGKEITFW